MKFIIQVGLDTDMELFDLRDKIEKMFLDEINNDSFSNHVIVKMIAYDKIFDKFYDIEGKTINQLEGYNNHDGFSFHIYDKTKSIPPITDPISEEI